MKQRRARVTPRLACRHALWVEVLHAVLRRRVREDDAVGGGHESRSLHLGIQHVAGYVQRPVHVPLGHGLHSNASEPTTRAKRGVCGRERRMLRRWTVVSSSLGARALNCAAEVASIDTSSRERSGGDGSDDAVHTRMRGVNRSASDTWPTQ